jgi:hypothetical protein
MLIIKTMPPDSLKKSQPKYAKNAQVGGMVHLKATHATAEAQCNIVAVCGRKMDVGGGPKHQKRPVNGQNQCFFVVEYTLPGGLKKSVTLCDIHCHPGVWSNTTSTPTAPLLGVDTEDQEQDLASIDLLEVPWIVDNGVSCWKNHSLLAEPVDELVAHEPQPPPTPVAQPVVQWQVPPDGAKEEQVQSDDDDSDIKPTLTADNLNW